MAEEDTGVITQPDQKEPLPYPEQYPGTPEQPQQPNYDLPTDPVSLDALRGRISRAEEMMGVYQNRALETIQKQRQAGQDEVERQRELIKQREPQRRELIKQAQQPLLTQEQMTDLQTPVQMPQYQAKPVIEPEEFKKFFGMAWLMSMVLGKVAGADMTQGLNMMSSAINGYVTGAKEKANEDAQQFKLKTESALNTQREKLGRYTEIIRARQMDMNAKMNALRLEAIRDDDQQMLYALQQNNYGLALKYYEKQIEQLNKVAGSATQIWRQMDQHKKTLELADMRAAQHATAQASLDSYRQERLAQIDRGLELKGEGEQNRLMGSFEKTYSSIVQQFERATQQALLKAGGNQELLRAVIEEEAQWAASQMRTLNQEIEGVTFAGGRHLVIANHADRALVESPEYWKSTTQGFAKIKTFVPPVVIQSQQPPPQYEGGGSVENPPVAGEQALGGTVRNPPVPEEEVEYYGTKPPP